MDAPTLTIDLAVAMEDRTALRRQLGPALGRARPGTMAWHDDAEGTLARAGVALVAWRDGRLEGWRSEGLDPALAPGAPPLVLREGVSGEGLPGLVPAGSLVPVQRLEGRVREGLSAAIAVRLIEGRLADGSAVARLRLAGPLSEVLEIGTALAAALRVTVPLESLSGEALGRAGLVVPGRRLGAPALPPGLAPGTAFAQAAGHLLGVLLHHAPAAAAGHAGEPVHQMRVALRRLRALASVFGPLVACPELEAVRPRLKAMAQALGPARDWDVFLDGTGRQVRVAFPEEAALAGLLEGAAARRAAAYGGLAVLLEGAELRQLSLMVAGLALARPWEHLAEGPQPGLAAFARVVLARRMRRLGRHAGGFDAQPEAALHEMRLTAKRLRYAAEAFAPLYPGGAARRFLKRLAALQEALGHLNDGAVAAGLMRELAEDGGAALAGGLVRGFVAGRGSEARAQIERAWKRLHKAGRFWD